MAGGTGVNSTEDDAPTKKIIEAATKAATKAATEAATKAATQAAVDATNKTLGDVLYSWSTTWNNPLTEPLPIGQRRIFAFTGALPWVIYNLALAEWISYLQGLDNVLVAAAVLLGGIAIHGALAYWFAWLIAYGERRCSPTRLFLEGFLLPGLAAALLTGVTIFEALTRGAL